MSLSELHIDGTTGRFHICIMVRPSPARHGWLHEVCRGSVTARESALASVTARGILPGKSDSFGVSLAFVVHSTNSTKDQRVFSPLTSELAVDEREKASMQAGEGESTP